MLIVIPFCWLLVWAYCHGWPESFVIGSCLFICWTVERSESYFYPLSCANWMNWTLQNFLSAGCKISYQNKHTFHHEVPRPLTASPNHVSYLLVCLGWNSACVKKYIVIEDASIKRHQQIHDRHLTDKLPPLFTTMKRQESYFLCLHI